MTITLYRVNVWKYPEPEYFLTLDEAKACANLHLIDEPGKGSIEEVTIEYDGSSESLVCKLLNNEPVITDSHEIVL